MQANLTLPSSLDLQNDLCLKLPHISFHVPDQDWDQSDKAACLEGSTHSCPDS